MPTTRAALRQRVSEEIGDYRSLTTTSAGAVSGTTVVSTDFATYSADDDFCENWYILITSGNNATEIRRVSSYDAATTTATVTRAFSNQVASGVTFELHQFNPDDIHSAINRACERSFPDLYLPIRDETIWINDRLSNTDYESALVGGAHPSWTNSGTVTVTADTTRVFHGSQSARIQETSGAGVGQIYQDVSLDIPRLTGLQVTFRRMVYATTPDTARIRLDWNGTDIDSSDYHTGDDEWQLLTVQATAPANASRIRCICEVAANGVAYFDAGNRTGCFTRPIYRYTIPSSIVIGPTSIWEQSPFDGGAGAFYRIAEDSGPHQGRLLRLEGMGVLTLPSSDSSTVEVTSQQANVIVLRAAAWLLRQQARSASADEIGRYNEQALLLEAEWQDLLRRPGVRMQRMPVQLPPRNAYHWEEDSSGRYLVFERIFPD